MDTASTTNPDWTLAAIFSDEGITGTSAKKRPVFQKMISWCDRGKIDLIITKSITRFARNTEDCLHYVRYLQKLNIPVIFESEGIDTSRLVFDRIQVFEDGHLLIRFKSGEEVEQKLDF